MSNQDKFNAVDRAALENMSTQELNDLLRQTFELSALTDEDTNLILMITEVLDIRDKADNYIPVDVDVAWEDFKKEYLPLAEKGTSLYDFEDDETDVLNEHIPVTTTKKKRWTFKRIAGIAAALAIVIFAVGSLVPQADGSNLWSAFVEWTKETFGFNKDFQGEHEGYPEQLLALDTLLRDHGLSSMELLPKYIPEGYKEDITFCDERENTTVFLCQLSNDGNYIVLQYRLLKNEVLTEYQKNDGEPEEYVLNNLTHYITQNLDLFSASWVNGSMECSIQNVYSHDELIKMINSIYEE